MSQWNVWVMAPVLLVCLGVGGCATDVTRLSVYQDNMFDGQGNFAGPGRLELRESSRGASLRIVPTQGRISPCADYAMEAVVTRDETSTTVITKPVFGMCDSWKYVLANDGSGGQRFVQVSDGWAPDRNNHELTLVDAFDMRLPRYEN